MWNSPLLPLCTRACLFFVTCLLFFVVVVVFFSGWTFPSQMDPSRLFVCLLACLLGSHLFLGPFTPLSRASSGASGHSGDSMAPGASKEDLGWNNRLCQPKKKTPARCIWGKINTKFMKHLICEKNLLIPGHHYLLDWNPVVIFTIMRVCDCSFQGV